MFEADSFYSVLLPIFHVTKIFGLTPFYVTDRAYKHSRLNIGLILLITSLLFAYGLNLVDNAAGGTSSLTQLPSLFNSYLGPVSMFVCILVGCICSKELLQIIEDVNVWDRQTQSLIPVDLKREYKKSKIKLLVYLGGNFLHLFASLLFSAYVAKQVGLQYFLESLVLFFIPTAVTVLAGYQCCVFVMALKERFRWLNSELHRIATNTKTDEWLPVYRCLVLEKLRVKHYRLCGISKRVNSVYSVQILILVLKDFVTVVTGLFYMARLLMFIGTLPTYYALYCVVQLSLAAVQVSVLAVVCSSTSEEAQKTGSLIHHLASVINLQKDELKLQINYFSLQLLHQKVEFTGCKIFVVNENLLLTILGAVTTYLVIVVQFQMAEINPLLHQNESAPA